MLMIIIYKYLNRILEKKSIRENISLCFRWNSERYISCKYVLNRRIMLEMYAEVDIDRFYEIFFL